MIGNLQLIRAFAASGVVIYHCAALIFGFHTEFYGVALFFALSGYLMCKIKEKRSASAFAWERFLRIAPSYWLATALLARQLQPDKTFGEYLPSLFFIPHASEAGFYPPLGVGYTLNLEMYFYGIFALSIMINRKFAPLLCAGVIVAIALFLPSVTSNKAAIFYYTHPYVFCFVCGIGVWYFTEWLLPRIDHLIIPSWFFPIALLTYALMVPIVLGPLESTVVAFAAASLLLLAGVVSAKLGTDLRSKPIMLLGNASYACYLLHTIIIELFRQRGFAIDGSVGLTVIIFALSWCAALAWHGSIEKLIGLVTGRSPTSARVASATS
ncbi:acyltransferase [Rhizobium sp. 18055]|uniref:acyltransferase family protein n=1 Tax=Rhizobium sp. 18055 TaxID=2681403 RepID=UPI001357C11E|nr:acyltransferase [Rhizobium sp. 18055]